MIEKNRWLTLFWLTLLHLLVDGVCGAVLCRYAISEPYYEPIVYWFGVYTLLAFGLQGAAGWFFDVRPHFIRRGLAAASLLLCLGAVPSFSIGWQVAFIGLGNCLFHVAGGAYVLRGYGTFSAPGLFVCSGAIGLGLGLNGLVGVFPLAAALVVATFLAEWQMPSLPISEQEAERQAGGLSQSSGAGSLDFLEREREGEAPGWIFAGCAFLLLGCVVLRGFGTGGSESALPVMLLPLTMAAGKLGGGLLCDWVGYRRTVLVIFLVGFFALQLQTVTGSIAFVFACNLTMPLTLRFLHWCRRERPGLMFGLAASALVPGAFFKGAVELPPQFILALQFVILAGCGYALIGEENAALEQ